MNYSHELTLFHGDNVNFKTPEIPKYFQKIYSSAQCCTFKGRDSDMQTNILFTKLNATTPSVKGQENTLFFGLQQPHLCTASSSKQVLLNFPNTLHNPQFWVFLLLSSVVQSFFNSVSPWLSTALQLLSCSAARVKIPAHKRLCIPMA